MLFDCNQSIFFISDRMGHAGESGLQTPSEAEAEFYEVLLAKTK